MTRSAAHPANAYTPTDEDLTVRPDAEKGAQIKDSREKVIGILCRAEHLESHLLALKENLVQLWEDQPRKNTRLTTEQAEDTSDQLEPGLVVPMQLVSGARSLVFLVVSGSQRAQRARLNKRPFLARVSNELNVEKLFEDAVVANIAKRNMNPIETAEALRRIITERRKGTTMSLEEAVTSLKRTQKKPDYVYRHLRLLKAHPDLQQLIREEVISMATALRILTDTGDDKRKQGTIARRIQEAAAKDNRPAPRVLVRIVDEVCSVDSASDDGATETAVIAVAETPPRMGADEQPGRPAAGCPPVAARPARRRVEAPVEAEEKVRGFVSIMARAQKIARDLEKSRDPAVVAALRKAGGQLKDQVARTTNALEALAKKLRQT